MPDINPAQHHRHFLLLEGDLDACLAYFFSLSKNARQPILAAPDLDVFNPIKHPKLETCLRIPNKNLKQVLGQSHEAVFLDIEEGLSASAISLIAGTIKGGGVLVLSLRNQETWFNQEDIEQAKYLPWPLTSKDALANFKHVFWHKLNSSHVQLRKVSANDLPDSPLPKIAANQGLVATDEQTKLIQALVEFSLNAHAKKKANQPVFSSRLIIAHRGRGKSTALGIALAKIHQTKGDIKLAITGPNKAALTQVELSYQKALQAETHKGLFYSPDSLIHTPQDIDVLIVDEAAALPLPMLKALFEHYHQLVFSSTDHGYEGAGKGFGLKFKTYLKTKSQSFEQLELTKPIRWQSDDPLEAFINQLLLQQDSDSPQTNAVHKAPLYQQIHHKDWQKYYLSLESCFNLLVSAHYQTSPNDIRWILDDPSVNTWLMKDQNQLISTAIISEEGLLEATLAKAVAEGIRRPRGHLLPQSLLAHEGHLDAGDYSYWRISRIASQSHLQQQGYASKLLTKIGQTGIEDKIDFLSASFAATFDVVNFWQKNGFICVRLGTARDQASGCYSVMMLKPLNSKAEQQACLYHAFYLSNLKQNLERDYPEIDGKLAQALKQNSASHYQFSPLEMSTFKALEAAKDIQDLNLFAHHHRPYETIRAQLYRSVIAKKEMGQAQEMALLEEAALKPIRAANFTQFNLLSKKAIDKALRQSVALNLL
ncbi:hypothetical protein MED121_17754 [Marinomonas sp. MED121]|uniref:GNAT family N-acetyltransferase n=1 Tax=Marinomonas sp. MED121 TaxID=314277 RepID=UPI000069109C|nr:GNAT family N-acetyltransferase [Marinomonas sp. MED121]EAQ67796.1 hypothetical protein MED121_17754 [Marinomonas sp. MED121]